jgi:coenzyme F420-reducing hydrogenase delta subunit
MFHAIEGGSTGVCIITCPLGKCTLTQGNYRANIRVGNVKRLLTEIGVEPERVEIIHFSPDDSIEKLNETIGSIVKGFVALGISKVI